MKKSSDGPRRAGAAALRARGGAVAVTTVVVTPTNTQGWSTADTRPGGAVNYVVDATAPRRVGALQLTTDATTAAKAQYIHAANTPLAASTSSSYSTKQNAPRSPAAIRRTNCSICLGRHAPASPRSSMSHTRTATGRPRRVAAVGRRRRSVLVDPHRHAAALARSSPVPAAPPFYTLAG